MSALALATIMQLLACAYLGQLMARLLPPGKALRVSFIICVVIVLSCLTTRLAIEQRTQPEAQP